MFRLKTKHPAFWPLLIVLVLALLTETLFWAQGGEKQVVYPDAAALRSLEPEYYNNYTIEDGYFTPQGEDPQIGYVMEPVRVESVQILFSRPLAGEREIQVYYAGAGEELSESRLVLQTAQRGAETVIVDLPGGQYEHLRVDINGSFSFSGVAISDRDPVVRSSPGDLLLLGKYCGLTVLAALCLWWLLTRDLLYRYRWLIGGALFLLSVFLELSGSSIGVWSQYLSDEFITDDGILLGVNREIRSDEWAVFTPMALSQYQNAFQQYGEAFRGTMTDMFMVYGQPILDWTMIFRPFQLGYLFLSPAKGLAFYWVGKLVVLFLVSLEFGMLLTKKRKSLALAYAMLVTFAPVVQWWFSTNAFPDMLIYGQGIVLLLSLYMTKAGYPTRILCALGLSVCCGAYLLVLYPAWQVSFFYVFLMVGVAVIRENWKRFSFHWKKDLPILTGAVLLLAGCMFFIFSRSWETIDAVIHSVYPGGRVETGGGMLAALFRYTGNLFTPFVGGVPEKACEMASFYDLFPLGFLLSLYLFRRRGLRDGFSGFLWVAAALLGVYCVIGFPKLLSKALLLSLAPPGRAVVALSYVNLLLVLRSLALVRSEGISIVSPWLLLGCCLAAFVTAQLSYGLVYTSYFTSSMFILCTVVLIAVYLAALKGERSFCIAVCLLSLLIGGTVNPVRSGLEVIEQNRLGQAVRTLQAEDGGLWMAVSDAWMAGNFLAMNGAPTVNATNTYVNWDFWEPLDPGHEKQEIYNRYAHITVDLTDAQSTEVELLSPDRVHLLLNTAQLKEIGVKYIVSPVDLDEFSDEDTLFDLVYSAPGIAQKIYRLRFS